MLLGICFQKDSEKLEDTKWVARSRQRRTDNAISKRKGKKDKQWSLKHY